MFVSPLLIAARINQLCSDVPIARTVIPIIFSETNNGIGNIYLEVTYTTY